MTRTLSAAAVLFFLLVAPFFYSPSDGAPLAPPDSRHWLGANLLGEDLLELTLTSARATLIDTTLALAIGATLALGSLTVAGSASTLVRQIVRGLLGGVTALPLLLVALVIARLTQDWTYGIALALAIVAWPRLFKLLDGDFAELRVQPYYNFARVLGVRPRDRILHYHLPVLLRGGARVLPLEAVELVAVHATLAFLGIGVVSDETSLGRMILAGREFIELAPWLFWGPIAVLTIMIIALRALAPRTGEQEHV